MEKGTVYRATVEHNSKSSLTVKKYLCSEKLPSRLIRTTAEKTLLPGNMASGIQIPWQQLQRPD